MKRFCRLHGESYTSVCEGCELDAELKIASRQQHHDLNAEAASMSSSIGLPEIKSGSPAQREWATTIRIKAVQDRPGLISFVKTADVLELLEAKWWIDNRRFARQSLIDTAMRVKTAGMDANEQFDRDREIQDWRKELTA